MDYDIRIDSNPSHIDRDAWNDLLALASQATPFMRHEYLSAMHDSGCAVPATGWTPAFVTLWQGKQLQAACTLYLKTHSYGEYVFDWAWANAYAQHGLAYYPKALVAVPFTPVPGTRLLARDAQARAALVQALLQICRQQQLSSLHVLLHDSDDQRACDAHALMRRQIVQFHWSNTQPRLASFDHFLQTLTQEKRKKIKQERRKVEAAGVRFRTLVGQEIGSADWDFFYRCYSQTYFEHGNAPYLSRAFFEAMAREMAAHWVLFVGERAGEPIACSLVAVSEIGPQGKAYGRYWGAIERVSCLHFEACYYQPLQWCIAQGLQRFEGGAQGEHKLARGLLPVQSESAHWLAHPDFADAVARYLQREEQGVSRYLDELEDRSPMRADTRRSPVVT